MGPTPHLARGTSSPASDSHRRPLHLRLDDHLLVAAKSIDAAMRAGVIAPVRRVCADFLRIASGFYEVSACGIRVLAARPLRVREKWTSELFGDYDPSTKAIRVWMRTAIRKAVTSAGRSWARCATSFAIILISSALPA